MLDSRRSFVFCLHDMMFNHLLGLLGVFVFGISSGASLVVMEPEISQTPLPVVLDQQDFQPSEDFARCLTDVGVVMYGVDWCPHCQAQKASFGDAFRLIDYVECDQEPDRCRDADIVAYPTWDIYGERYTGIKALSELSELADCPLY